MVPMGQCGNPLLPPHIPQDASPFTVHCLPVSVNGILGESIIFPLDNPGPFKSVTWHGLSPANAEAYASRGPLAVITRGPGALPHFLMEDRYRGRARLHNQSYSLEISDLTLADIGILAVAGRATCSGFSPWQPLYNVILCFPPPTWAPERLSEPEIRIHSVMAGNGTCNVTFTCSAGKGNKTINYIWTCPAGAPVFSIEESLLVQHRLGEDDSPVTCTAMNPISNSSASASPKAAYEGSAPPQTPALSYCHAKGILVLKVLGTLLAGILTVNVLAAREQRRHSEKSFHCGGESILTPPTLPDGGCCSGVGCGSQRINTSIAGRRPAAAYTGLRTLSPT
ncbi:LOW QUALITY PROTEIN: SLAM family member 9-like [Macrochelys suwanniensis]